MNSQQPSTSLGYSSWRKHPWQQEISEITYNSTSEEYTEILTLRISWKTLVLVVIIRE
jgi:hypothetical protein